MRRLHLHGDLALKLVDPRDIVDAELAPPAASPSARAALVDFWQRRADGEWTTARGLEHVREDLLALSAPTSLSDLAARAIQDEYRHTEWCTAMARRLGGETSRAPRVIGDKPLAFSGLGALENRLVRVVFSGCLSETIALHVLRESQADIASAALRRANRQHMSEEVGHAQIGWAFLAWLDLGQPSLGAWRALLERTLPALTELACEAWRGGARDEIEELGSVGFLHSRHVERGIERALTEVIRPGLARYALGT